MLRIFILVRNLLRTSVQKTNLGRWSVETCNKKINRKIDWANQDHCGPCGTLKLIYTK